MFETMFQPSPQRRKEGTTILYVEDNADNRLLIQRILMFEGYRVIFAENAYEAIELVQNEKIDLILMDINLPDVDGYSLTASIRRMPHMLKVPILALTANVMRGDRERSYEAGCDGYIQKPIDIDSLPMQIEEYLLKR